MVSQLATNSFLIDYELVTVIVILFTLLCGALLPIFARRIAHGIHNIQFEKKALQQLYGRCSKPIEAINQQRLLAAIVFKPMLIGIGILILGMLI